MAPSRIRELDALRGIAAIAVLLFHLTALYDFHHAAYWRVTWGHYGVELFFIISGFVIFMTLERTRSVHDFAVSRAARLYPAYWAAIAATSILAYAAFPRWDPSPPGARMIAANLTMLQAFCKVDGIDNSYWTLAIELAFYLAMAVAFKARLMQRIETLCIVWLALAALVRTWLYLHHRSLGLPSTVTGLYYGQFFILGMMIYRLARGQTSRLTVPVMAAACLMSWFGGGPYSLHAPPLTYLCITLGFAACVLLAVTGRLAFLRWSVLVFLGEISYPLYLVHQRIGTDILGFTYDHGFPRWSQTALALGLTLGLAMLIHRFIEVPGRAFLNKQLSSSRRKIIPA